MKKTQPVSKTICLRGKEIAYTWTKKAIKNLNLRVRADGTVGLSTPLFTTQREAETFLARQADFLFSALERFEKRKANLPKPTAFQTGESLLIFGQKTELLILPGSCPGGELSKKILRLTLPHPEREADRRRTAEHWAEQSIQPIVQSFCQKAGADFARLSIPFPTVKFRRMRSRWGSCNSQKAILTFNVALIGAPLDAIEYVVYHEFAHLVHPDHSRAFHALVARFLPDWKSRRAMLKEVPCSLFGQ